MLLAASTGVLSDTGVLSPRRAPGPVMRASPLALYLSLPAACEVTLLLSPAATWEGGSEGRTQPARTDPQTGLPARLPARPHAAGQHWLWACLREGDRESLDDSLPPTDFFGDQKVGLHLHNY